MNIATIITAALDSFQDDLSKFLEDRNHQKTSAILRKMEETIATDFRDAEKVAMSFAGSSKAFWAFMKPKITAVQEKKLPYPEVADAHDMEIREQLKSEPGQLVEVHSIFASHDSETADEALNAFATFITIRVKLMMVRRARISRPPVRARPMGSPKSVARVPSWWKPAVEA